ncbi:MAG: phosphate-starvation-inducible PsiE family protein [Methanospirillaceae archaeon]|nr:phosphate-starvation-inducible PsiE family protein [Methanospirillaceae archaeon]
MEDRYLRFIGHIEVMIYLVLIGILAVVLAFGLIELIVLIIYSIITEADLLMGTKGLLNAFEFFLLILIGLELLETIRAFLTDKRIHLEIVLTLAAIAIARKIIIFDLAESPDNGIILIGMGVIIMALTAGYYLVKKADQSASGIKIF